MRESDEERVIDYLRTNGSATASDIGAALRLHHTAVGRIAAGISQITKRGSYYELEE